MSSKFRKVITLVIVAINYQIVIAQYSYEEQDGSDISYYYDNEISGSSAEYIEDEPVEYQGHIMKLKHRAYKKPSNKQATEETVDPNDCWLKLTADDFFKSMDNLDNQYEKVRQNYQQNVGEGMDRQMLEDLLSSRAAAHRAIFKVGGDPQQIPAGINLGGYSMMRQQNSILFFHRMKLRNSTIFQVDFLHNDLMKMTLNARISLNDLHLLGAYERSVLHNDPSILYYRPSFGTLEFLLKNVTYKIEARLRMMSDRFTVELINSDMRVNNDILMTYFNTNITERPEYTVKMETHNLDDFLLKLKTDLDLWMVDYFNDYFMYYQLPEYDHTQFQEYEKKKTMYLNEYVNYAVNTIRQKIYDLGGHALKLPQFTTFSAPNMVLRIKDGVLRGLDTMHRRSVATGVKVDQMRIIDVIVGFSKLKVEYTLEALLPNGSPPLTGMLLLSANEVTAHLAISLVTDPSALDLSFDFIQQIKPESLTIEGPANRLIANFKHHLENQLISLLTNTLMHNIKMLNTLTRCTPFLFGHLDPDLARSSEKKTNYHRKKPQNRP